MRFATKEYGEAFNASVSKIYKLIKESGGVVFSDIMHEWDLKEKIGQQLFDYGYYTIKKRVYSLDKKGNLKIDWIKTFKLFFSNIMSVEDMP